MMIRRIHLALALGALPLLSCIDAVEPATPAAVGVFFHVAPLELGDTTRAEVVAIDENGRRIDGAPTTLTSNNLAVARVETDGRVIAVGPGDVTITAKVRGIAGSAPLTVVLTVASITVSAADSALSLGDSMPLSHTARSSRGLTVERAFTFATSDAAVATVSDAGVVRGVGVGTATITATLDDKSAAIPIAILAPPASLRIEPASPRIDVSSTLQLSVVALDGAGNVLPRRRTTFSSGDVQRVILWPSGLATWAAPGRTVVTARSGPTTATVTVSTAGDFAISRVMLTQGIQDSAGTVPLISQGRGAAVVVLLNTQVRAVANMDVALRLYDATGNVVFTSSASPWDAIDASPSLESPSVVLSLPAEQIRNGVRWQVVRDPGGLALDDDAATDVFPREGPAELKVTDVPPLKLRLVPVVLTAHGNSTPHISVTDLPAYVRTARSLLPLGQITATLDQPFSSAADFGVAPTGGTAAFWNQVLQDMDLARITSEPDSSAYWYGVVSPPPEFTSIQHGGFGFVPQDPQSFGPGTRTSLGVRTGWGTSDPAYARDVLAHELGHNLGRRHSPCGGATGVDPNYPRADGSIGELMHDVYTWSTTPGSLLSAIAPTRGDLMGYCRPRWVSTYTYVKILDSRGPALPASGTAAQEPTNVLVIQGRVRLDGASAPTLLPAVALRGHPSLPRGTGEHHLQGFDAEGQQLFDYAFSPARTDHDPASGLFSFALPRDGVVGRLAQIRVVGPSGSAVLDDAARPSDVAPALQRAAGGVTATCGDASARIAVQDDLTGRLLGVGAGSLTVATNATRLAVSCGRAVTPTRRAFDLR